MPTSSKPYLYRGRTREAKGDHDGAIADYTQATRLNPTDSVAYAFRGNARLYKGDFDGAIADSDEAIRLLPKFNLAYLYRGNARDADLILAKALKAGQPLVAASSAAVLGTTTTHRISEPDLLGRGDFGSLDRGSSGHWHWQSVPAAHPWRNQNQGRAAADI